MQHVPDVVHNKRTARTASEMMPAFVKPVALASASVNCALVACVTAVFAGSSAIVGRQPRSPAMRPDVGRVRTVFGNSVAAIVLFAFFICFLLLV